MLRKLTAIVTSVGVLAVAIIATFVFWDVHNDRKKSVRITGDTALLRLPYPKDYPGVQNKPVTTLKAGTPVRVLRIRYGKDYMAVKVQTPTGEKGWLIAGENQFEFTARGRVQPNSALHPGEEPRHRIVSLHVHARGSLQVNA